VIWLGKSLKMSDLGVWVLEDRVVPVNSDQPLDPIVQELNPGTDLGSLDGSSARLLIPVDPHHISYTIVDCAHGHEEIIRQTINSRPMRAGKGHYFAPIKIDPKLFRIGRHLVLWHVRKYHDGTMELIVQEFDVVRQSHWSGEFSNSTYSDHSGFKGYNNPKGIFKIRRD